METIIYFCELFDNEDFAEYEKYMRFISPEKQKRIHKYRFDIDKKLSLFSDLLVRYLACTKLNLNNSELIFSKNAYSKPYLVGYPAFQYNVSHE